MAWLAVDGNGEEFIYSNCPEIVFGNQFYLSSEDISYETGMIELPLGSIEKLIGRKLTFEDEPVEI